jgi:hypothetical protein
MMLLLVILNGVLGPILDGRERPREPWLVRAKWELVEKHTSKVDWLFLGDSACSQSVDPQVWLTETGETALNLCTTENMGLVNDAWLFNIFLRRHPNPRNVVLVHAPTTWRRSMRAGLMRQIPLDWDTLSELRPQFTALADMRSKILLHRYLPLVSRRQEWMRLLGGQSRTAAGAEPPVTELGFTPGSPARRVHAQRTARRIARALKDKPFKLSAHNRSALHRIAYLARHNEINVWIVSAPVLKGLGNRPSFRAFMREGAARLGTFAHKRPHVRFLEHVVTLPPEQMVNATHVAPPGADVFTRELARLVTSGGGTAPSVPDSAPHRPVSGPQ